MSVAISRISIVVRGEKRYDPLGQDKVPRLAGLGSPTQCYFSIPLSSPGLCSGEHLFSQVVIKTVISKESGL